MENRALGHVLPLSFLISIVLACAGSSENRNSFDATSVSSPSPTPTSTAASVENPAQKSAGENKAEYRGFPYTFKKDGNKTVALFLPRFLPRDDKTFIGATLDVIKRSYEDTADSNARLVHSGGTRLIRLSSKKNGYLVMPVKEDSGEIHSIVIEQIPLN